MRYISMDLTQQALQTSFCEAFFEILESSLKLVEHLCWTARILVFITQKLDGMIAFWKAALKVCSVG